MSHLRVLICRGEDEVGPRTELANSDLPPVPTRWAERPLDTLDAQVATTGQRLLASLCALAWNESDGAAVARYWREAAPGSLWGDGDEALTVASRLGALHLRWRVVAHRDGRPHVLPGNAVLPPHHGLLIARPAGDGRPPPAGGALRHGSAFAGRADGEPGLLSAPTVRT